SRRAPARDVLERTTRSTDTTTIGRAAAGRAGAAARPTREMSDAQHGAPAKNSKLYVVKQVQNHDLRRAGEGAKDSRVYVRAERGGG
ncbi:unnamed protein product, partial [Parnassius apollo]